MKNYLISRIGLFYYGILSIVEAFWNMVMYILNLDLISKKVIADFSIPLYFKYTDKFQKKGFLQHLADETSK